MQTILIVLGLLIVDAVIFYFVGRNNPNLSAVNKLISAKKAAVDVTGQIVSIIKGK